MSNFWTEFVRVYAQSGHRIYEAEAQWITWMLLGPCGSYHVPVRVRRDPRGRYVDIQYGSGKSSDTVDFCLDHVGGPRYSTIWGRCYRAEDCEEVIWQGDVNDGPRRYCRYGLDEVRVITADGRRSTAIDAPWQPAPNGSWQLKTAGSYRTGNDRTAGVGHSAVPTIAPVDVDAAVVPLATPTTPNLDGEELVSIDPPCLGLLTEGTSTALLVEYRWRGRPVHRAWPLPADGIVGSENEWAHRCADDWDNTLGPEFLRFTGATDLVIPAEFCRRDEEDWVKRKVSRTAGTE